jgi:hypothetical protein
MLRGIQRDRTAIRVAICTLAAVLGGHHTYAQILWRVRIGGHSDLGQSWFAARAILHGLNPYALIGPCRAFVWPAGWFYPLPAALVLTPIALLPEPLAAALFAGIAAAGLAWALTEHGYGPLWAFASTCVIHAFQIAQWSPMMAAAYAIPPLGVLLVAKPTLGAAVFAAKPSRWVIGGGLLLVALSFGLQPHWFSAWREALHETSLGGGQVPYPAPVMFPSGLLILLALLRWRRPEARLLVAMAVVPQTALPYEGLLLFLIPRTWREAAFLSLSSWAMLWYTRTAFDLTPGLPGALNAYGHTMVSFLYLPTTIMVLRRPNEGPVPAWLDRRTAHWPAWLRGGHA